ncbi:MAG: DNA repair protein RadA [Flavobacteriaceae bacterium]|nr:DNA repair protein RadA [Flavobacteriaceae bacterium]
MAQKKSVFLCKECGTQHMKWQGQCNGCKAWHSLVEESLETKKNPVWQTASTPKIKSSPKKIREIQSEAEQRITLPGKEFNRVLGGGLVKGSVLLLGGEPGVGKSTLMLQVALRLHKKILYISGEESLYQIKLRADRIVEKNESCYLYNESSLDSIFEKIPELEPELIIIDSIQTLQSDHLDSIPGTISQIRECAAQLIQFAKTSEIPVILIGHITKDGQIAGPKLLEHMVDVVLQFEGDKNNLYRILRAHKNRFGSTREIGIYEMLNEGLKEVLNPSEHLLGSQTGLSGTAVAAALEGARPLLIEVQALVSSAVYGTPQRSSTGYNTKRLNMILAVLEKRVGFKLATKDVFLNVTGGIQINDPAIDLAVIIAVLSSNFDIPIPAKTCFCAEIGLAGEIRPVARTDQRINEAEKLGFKHIYVAADTAANPSSQKIKVHEFQKIDRLVKAIFQESLDG